jgi:hypothetical protein
MKKLKQHRYFLNLLAKSSPSQKRALLRSADKSQISSLCEICLNVLAGNIPIKVKKFSKYKKTIRKIADKKTSLNTKKRLLVNQIGGFLPALLPIVLSALSGIAGKVIGERI